ncbi:hypothetical protein EIO_3299 (plasmid) [Ketogulonicigenium vulgare Y25]|uniref:Anti-sigma factor NepR domain-containing protein n=1 Tax=Ketogulonicigenium vulgare (strain WSH-001) TaxID=759362 RepID=F9YBN5_KETVW|nr:hypothetical protein EIO_3299 [Ketogulonicigenium vulgare Y25]AEM42787.1 hypothetical protein KVU_PB0109 [Ketogulonicigenium vulgare WSH-001]ALJ82882.1 hypothetical protein KVH_15825 [Ketogulonicigenium vulgare]
MTDRDAIDHAAALDPALQRQVDENLQLLYRSKLNDDLPDSLQALVKKLLEDGRPS